MTTPNDIAATFALEHKHSLRRQSRQDRRSATLLALIGLLFVAAYGWLMVLAVGGGR